MASRRESRKLALQTLYSLELNRQEPGEGLSLVLDQFESEESCRPFARDIVTGVYRERPRIDALIESASRNWKIGRMPPVDRNILRIALFEMLYCGDIPVKVSINEAVELGKLFGDKDSGAFINGILDRVKDQISNQTSGKPTGPDE